VRPELREQEGDAALGRPLLIVGAMWSHHGDRVQTSHNGYT
jgi:hypothetical protein